MTSAVADPPQELATFTAESVSTVVVRPAPLREPPFDDEIVTGAATIGCYDRRLPLARPRRRRPPAAAATADAAARCAARPGAAGHAGCSSASSRRPTDGAR